MSDNDGMQVSGQRDAGKCSAVQLVTVTRSDLWRVAGGIDAVTLSFLKADIFQQETSADSAIWSTLAREVFKNDTSKNRKWLYVMWRYNRKNIRGLFGEWSQLKETRCTTGEDTQSKENEDSLSDTSAVSIVSQTEKLTELDLRDEITSETLNEQETEQDFPKPEERKVEAQENDDASQWAEEELPVRSKDSEAAKPFKRNGSEEDDNHFSELSSQASSAGHGECSGEEAVLFESREPSKVLESDGDTVSSDDSDKASSSSTMSGGKKPKTKYRPVPPIPSAFKILISATDWKTIAPSKYVNKLRKPWTNIIYQQFRKKNPCCALHFTYQHIRSKATGREICHI